MSAAGIAPETAKNRMRLDALTEAPLIRIVDDDPNLRDALLFMLSQEGWRAVAFPDGESFFAFGGALGAGRSDS